MIPSTWISSTIWLARSAEGAEQSWPFDQALPATKKLFLVRYAALKIDKRSDLNPTFAMQPPRSSV
jgi:hypothetical protein